ncbi:MAG TPA: class I SAM-dependent methyltransferase [Candidatus Baltobacteraceae bacterium]|nr:class I SAM-dependent methyltransferase [Candidatus Baltobacteraceae bacterium]
MKAISDKVSAERWRAAQQWEEQHWIGAQKARARFFKNYIWRILSAAGLVSKYRGDDWNEWWKRQFDNYQFLPSTVNNALEAGCGPYTNVRLMLDRCHFEHLYLSDPLIRTYAKFKLTFVAERYRNADCMLDDHPLEELPFADNYFDLAVMINVLDHVQDAGKCMENLIRIVKPGGILILGQDLTNEQDLAALKNDAGAIGHPIKLDAEWFAPFLGKKFAPIIYKTLSREEGRAPEFHCGDLIFAGRKL